MKIKGFWETSFLDWDGKIVSTLFLPKCNFACPYCQNWRLIKGHDELTDIPFSEIERFLVSHKEFIDGVCITGGEPLVHSDLPKFIASIKKLGFVVKVDTNGSKPDLLKKLIDDGLVDYIAMDVKAPPNKYEEAAGVKIDLKKIERSIRMLMKGQVDYEFRTTVVPSLIEKEDIVGIAKWVKGCSLYVLQQYMPKDAMMKKYRKVIPYEYKKFAEFAEAANKYVKRIKLRGV